MFAIRPDFQHGVGGQSPLISLRRVALNLFCGLVTGHSHDLRFGTSGVRQAGCGGFSEPVCLTMWEPSPLTAGLKPVAEPGRRETNAELRCEEKHLPCRRARE